MSGEKTSESVIRGLMRSHGVPTRVTDGLHLFPKNLPCHCKPEAYLPRYGWASFDVSELTRVTDYELAPEASGRVSLVSTVYAEADGEPFPTPDQTKSEFSWTTAHKYTADKPAVYPFKEWQTLAK